MSVSSTIPPTLKILYLPFIDFFSEWEKTFSLCVAKERKFSIHNLTAI